MHLGADLTSIKGIGPKRAETLGKLGLLSVHDLLYYAPKAHYDLQEATPIAMLEHDAYAVVRIESIEKPSLAWPIIGGRRTAVVSVTISDGEQSMRCVWYNQSYMLSNIPRFAGGFIHGRIDRTHGIIMINGVFCPSPPGVMPIYPLVKGIGQQSMRTCIKSALRSLDGKYGETLPDGIRLRHSLCQLGFALENLHFPISMQALSIAKRRFVFEDVLCYSILLERLRARTGNAHSVAYNTKGLAERFLATLPFRPTNGQLEIMRDIERDLGAGTPMNRLIQGDVGSGKTVLALYAMFIASENGYQSALMAPTELLAEQHYSSLKRCFGNNCGIITGSMKKMERDNVLRAVENGELSAVVGTHALIEGRVKFNKLGLVVTDEQHRFGVRQRAHLGKKADSSTESANVLIMSATPIPRTLSLILYGDLDVSRLTELPHGRKPISTRYVPPSKRLDMYRFIETEIKRRGVQAFVVCPMIEENEVAVHMLSAEAVYAELKKELDVRIALIHGKMKPVEREKIMACFRDGESDLLVSTTVIEVGVDVPNACIMVVECSDRFGLAQLHQLRGRVGRSDKDSYCFLLSAGLASTTLERIKTLIATNDGFAIAEKDLETRGPGELLGQRQHGMPEFISTMTADMATLNEARAEAIRIVNETTQEATDVIKYAQKRYENVLRDIAIN